MRFGWVSWTVLVVLCGEDVAQATIPEAEGCATFTDSLAALSVTLASETATGSLTEGGFDLVLNTVIIPPYLDKVAIETSSLYNILVVPKPSSSGSNATVTAGLMRVATTADGGTSTVSLTPGPNGQDAACMAPWVGVSTTSGELGAMLVVNGNGTVSLDVTVLTSTTLQLYTTKYTLSANVDIPDFPTVTPQRVTAAPTLSPTVSNGTSAAPTTPRGITSLDPTMVTNTTRNTTDDSVALDTNETMVDDSNSTSVSGSLEDNANITSVDTTTRAPTPVPQEISTMMPIYETDPVDTANTSATNATGNETDANPPTVAPTVNETVAPTVNETVASTVNETVSPTGPETTSAPVAAAVPTVSSATAAWAHWAVVGVPLLWSW